jgi:hypothetical protein
MDHKDNFDKMVVIDGWDSYNTIYQKIEKSLGELTQRDSEAGESEAELQSKAQQLIIERQNLYDFILRQISVFGYPR